MAKKKLFGFIEKDPLIWFHYIPLVGIVVFTYFLSQWLGLMELVENNAVFGWSLLLALYYVMLLVGDQLVHKIIGKY